MNKIKFLKNNYIKLNQTIYKPYTICQLADTSFGQIDEDGYSVVNQWFNYKGFTYVAV
jgi:Ser-tRNA(Ala) deacylase AlaX